MHSEQEKLFQALESVTNDEQQQDPLLEQVREEYNHADASARLRQYEGIDTQEAYRQFYRQTHRRQRSVWKYAAGWMAAAAAVVAAVVILYPRQGQTEELSLAEQTAQSIPMFSDSLPQLSIDDKQTISLDDSPSNLAFAGTSTATASRTINLEKAEYTEDVRNLELIVPRGRQYYIVLPDGSKVWVNSGSRLRFPSRFTQHRQVAVSGQAFFDVKKDGRPFSVVCSRGMVNVTGTTFDIRDYQNENTQITLLSGHISYQSNNGPSEDLQPGDRITHSDREMELGQVDVQYASSWKDGMIYFKNQRLDEVMSDIERLYDVKVVYRNPSCKELRFTGSCSRYHTVDEFMHLLSLTEEFNYEISDKTITIK
jgi:ferric-dicitrate binding protein FerR (iron transport regulator)